MSQTVYLDQPKDENYVIVVVPGRSNNSYEPDSCFDKDYTIEIADGDDVDETLAEVGITVDKYGWESREDRRVAGGTWEDPRY